jgi:CBS domain-containing protein
MLDTNNAVDKKGDWHKEWDVEMKKKVEEIMTKEVITAKENDTLLEVASVLKENKIAGVPVLNEQEEVVGVVSEADVLKLLENFHWYTSIFTAHDLMHVFGEDLHDIQQDIEKASKMKVKDVMSKNPRTIPPDTLIDDAAQIMHSTGFNRLPVVDEKGKLVGIVARADIISSLYEP